ncbi:uncharacterized protein LOC121357760 [Pyrgilauda ruficollis]|uniref:uncharacterized protein LOC121357760 n=1 Tax=Pyrgilauda ruficollis TaxID=221976 RepID=UPI001B872B60|nr:uncharacterized protein LOC121357760 [Pyrgilauda ruficollis]
MEKEKFQQKALKQTKQKKSKSAEFLMVKEERAATEGIENPAFNISSTHLSAYQLSEEKVIRHDKPDSTLAAHQQKLGLQAHAEPRGNEYSRNYFDPLMGEEINPRQCGMEVSEEDPVKFDEQILYSKLMKLLDEENKMLDFQARVVSEDFPDAVMPVSSSKACDLHWELEDEEIPSYIEQFERDVQDDIILLGSFSLEQGQPVEDPDMTNALECSARSLNSAGHGSSQEDAGSSLDLQHGSGPAQSREQLAEPPPSETHHALSVPALAPPAVVGSQLLKTEQSGTEEEMVASFGNLTDVNTGLNGAAGPCGKVDCSKMPQPLEIHLRCLRGVKDKVPKGLYTLKVSVLSRLGGALVEWPELEEQPQARTTRPVSHGGNFYNTEIYFGQSIQTIIKLPQDSDKQNKCGMHVHLPPELLMCSSTAEKNGVSEKVVQSGPQGQPLTSPKDPDTHKGSIPTVVKEVEKQFNAAKGGEACVSEEAVRKREEFKMLPAEDYQDCHDNTDKHCGSYWLKKVQEKHHKVSRNKPPDQCYEEKSGPESNKSQEEGKTSPESNFYLEDLEKYTFSVCCHSAAADVKVSRQVVERFHFVVYTAFSELGATRWRSRDFWLVALLVVLLWFLRLYLHYLSQWLFLRTISVPVTKFQLFPHTVELCYQNSLLHTSEELAMVVVGPLTLNAGLLLMVLIRWGCQQLFDSFPSFLSKFIIAMGLWTVLDPLAVFVVDSFLGRFGNSVEKPIADAAKLSWVFLRAGESGVPGALITVMLYTILFMISSTVLYLYFLRLHSEGWLLDVFRRIHGEEGTFFVPLDLEISSQELSYIMKRAEQWRGINGERRMVSGEQSPKRVCGPN